MDDEERAVTDAAYAALSDGDRPRLRLLLHPYLHWTGPDGTIVRGRVNTLAMLDALADRPSPPASVELRDGQIYRWHSA